MTDKQRIKELEVELEKVKYAAKLMLSAMNMQVKREEEAFHIKQEVAWSIWSDAVSAADKAGITLN